MMIDKIELIDKICNLHPSLGVDKGWSHYTGGMTDNGDWNFRKMLDVPIEELREVYDSEILRQQQWGLDQIKDHEDFLASGMTAHEWTMKGFSDFQNEINKKIADIFINTYVYGGNNIKPKEGNDTAE